MKKSKCGLNHGEIGRKMSFYQEILNPPKIMPVRGISVVPLYSSDFTIMPGEGDRILSLCTFFSSILQSKMEKEDIERKEEKRVRVGASRENS